MCPHTCKVGPQASFIMENIDADIPCIFFKTFRSPLQDILQRELHIYTRTWLIMLITIKPWLPSIHLNSPWYARWAICIVHVWSAIAYGIWVIQSYAETYLLGILYNCRRNYGFQKLNAFSGQTLLKAAIFCHTATDMVQIENSSFQQFALVQGLQNFRGPSNIMF